MSTSKAAIRSSLVSRFDDVLVDELLASYIEAKENYYAGGLRLSAVEGGRFAEAAFRLLQQETTGAYEPLGRQLKTDTIIKSLENIPRGAHPDSVRLHIPRALRVVYDIRSNRDAVHLADGIDPNLQDATLVISTLDWVMAELVRLYYKVPPDHAARVVEELVTRKAPIIQDFDGFLKVLNPALGASDQCLALIYQGGSDGATYEEIESWVHPRSRHNLKRTLTQMVDDKAYAHHADGRYRITIKGRQEAETRRILQP